MGDNFLMTVDVEIELRGSGVGVKDRFPDDIVGREQAAAVAFRIKSAAMNLNCRLRCRFPNSNRNEILVWPDTDLAILTEDFIQPYY